jgi:hypothetical protein
MEEAEKEVKTFTREIWIFEMWNVIFKFPLLEWYRVVRTRCRIRWDRNPGRKCGPKTTTARHLGPVPRPFTWNPDRRNLTLLILASCPPCLPCPVKASVAPATI